MGHTSELLIIIKGREFCRNFTQNVCVKFLEFVSFRLV
jgi:hypothetical protein